MTRLSGTLLALVLAAGLGGTLALAESTASQRLSIETLPYPAGVARPGATASYDAPDLSALRQTVTYDGASRTYYLHVPDTASPGPRPVIVLLHGAQRSGASMIHMWQDVADQHGAVLVAPDSFGPSWSPVEDHPNFLMTTLRDASARAPLDASRVYLFGHSAGGIIATLDANRVGTPWRAVATHAGTLDPANIAQAETAPPMRHYVGTNDHLFPGRAAQLSAQALAEAGHDVELRMIRGHTHWYYEIGPHLSVEIWDYWQGLD